MNMAKPPASVLTHGGDSETAILSTLKTHTEHMEAQHDTHMKGAGEVIDRRHMHYDDVPKGWNAEANKVVDEDKVELEPESTGLALVPDADKSE